MSLGKGLESLQQTTKRLLGLDKPEVKDPNQFSQWLDKWANDPKDQTYKGKAQAHYSELYRAYQSLVDEENLVKRLERSSQIRNVIFRIATTLGIGFSIMFVYWVASCWEISMPLLRLSV